MHNWMQFQYFFLFFAVLITIVVSFLYRKMNAHAEGKSSKTNDGFLKAGVN